MLNEKFADWLTKTFSTVAYQGNPSSKKFKWNGKVFKSEDAFNTVQDAYKDAVASGKAESTSATLYKSDSGEAKEILEMLREIAKGNKKAHSQHEEVRRAVDVSGSLGDTLTKLNEKPNRVNRVDVEILSHFRLAKNDAMKEVFYVDEEGGLHSIGMFTDGSRNLQSIAEAMAKKHPIDIANTYEVFEKALSDSYNQLQTMTESEIEAKITEKGWNQWPEIKATYHIDLESVLLAMIAHYRANLVPTLPWAMSYLSLYRVISTKQEGETKVSWTSGFKVSMVQGMILDDVTYYKLALQYPQYFPEFDESPRRFGDVYTLDEETKPSGNVRSCHSLPFLKMAFHDMSTEQMKVFCAFWYCVAYHKQTPSLLNQDNGGNAKNGMVEVINEGLAELWKCPKKAVTFKLERDQLANRERKYHVKSDGLCKRTLLDSLYVFYDEVAPSKEMWEEFKALTGANQVSINVRPLYGDPYTVTNAPVPFYLTRNTFMPLYERGPMLRRLMVIRTNANNNYLYVLNDEERKLLDDPQLRKDTFATLMRLGKKAYDEIESLGGMLNVNNIFPEIGNVLGSSSDDNEEEMKLFYKDLFDAKPGEEKIQMTCEEIWKKFVRMYPDLEDDQKRMETKLSVFLLGVDTRNERKRIRLNGKRPTVYVLHKNEVISAMADPTDEAA